VVSGPTATIGGTVFGQGQVAGGFTAAFDYVVTQIDVGFWFPVFSPPDNNNTNGFALSLNQDAGGAPGAAIQSWTGLSSSATTQRDIVPSTNGFSRHHCATRGRSPILDRGRTIGVQH
jgi:hypothetical protein